MRKCLAILPILSLATVGLVDLAQMSHARIKQQSALASTSPLSTGRNLSQLFSKIWRVTKAPSQPASGNIYVFLADGTLLQTSCVETYRIGTWTMDKAAPDVLRVIEDGRLAYTAKISKLTDTNLQLQQTLVPSNEQKTIDLTAIRREFVCPDLRK
jgi:hypothetical protein